MQQDSIYSRPITEEDQQLLKDHGCYIAPDAEVSIADVCLVRNVEFRGKVSIGRSSVCKTVLHNVQIGDGCVIDGAQLVEDSTITSGSQVLNGSIVRGSTVSECSVITDGFTLIDSSVTVCSHLACGEAVECVCGPHTVSHHKSTLLIGGTYSMFNAGSGTNFSNHAYKMGPLHHGTLLRGCKTASNAHVIWPATIGAFSVCIGNIYTHPETTSFPFSYLLGDGHHGTRLVPGKNVGSCGLWRDVFKWEKRDIRSSEQRLTTVDYNWLGDDVLSQVREGLALLCDWQDHHSASQQAAKTTMLGKGFFIEAKDVEQGIRMYELILRLADSRTKEDAMQEWKQLVIADARKEFELGDITEETLHNFIADII